jgi:hypothetical protein
MLYYGPWDVLVSGVSSEAVGTTTAQSAQYSFTVQPFNYVSSADLSGATLTSGLALNNDVLDPPAASSVTFSNDVFLQSNTVSGGSVTIASSTLSGTLYVKGSTLTLVDVNGGSIVATDSSIDVINSHIDSLTLGSNSSYSMSGSSVGTVTGGSSPQSSSPGLKPPSSTSTSNPPSHPSPLSFMTQVGVVAVAAAGAGSASGVAITRRRYRNS